MYIEKAWKKEMKNALKISTNFSDKEIDKIIETEWKERFRDHPAVIHSIYNQEFMDTTLAECLDWIQTRRPIVCESGCFFQRVDEKRALHSMIVEGDLEKRKVNKGKMFDAMRRNDRVMEVFFNNLQLTNKLMATAPYGVDSNPYSFSYNYNVASSTTFVGRGQTAIAVLCFENLLYNTVKFWNMDEMYDWISKVKSEKDEWKFSNDAIYKIPTKKEFVVNLKSRFQENNYDLQTLVNISENIPEDLRTRLYYKSNLKTFFLHTEAGEILAAIMSSPSPLDNPYAPEEDIAPLLKLLCEITVEFVGYKHRVFRYEDTARQMKRKSTIITDTDSAIEQLCEYVRWYKKEIGEMPTEAQETKFCNILIAIMTYAVTEALRVYLEHVNVDNSKGNVKLKNEFLMKNMLITTQKKAYMSLIVIKEGVKYTVPKIDLKGVTFKKSTATPRTTEFISESILNEEILFNKTNSISISNINRKIAEYKREMREGIEKGSLEYHKTSTKVKDAKAYTASLPPGVKGVKVWNHLHPNNPILLPATVCLLKTKVFSEKHLEVIEDKFPEVYEKLLELIQTDTDLKGEIKYICLPSSEERVPDWAIPLLDQETIISQNLSLFSQLAKPLHIAEVLRTSSDSKSTLKNFSNIIRI